MEKNTRTKNILLIVLLVAVLTLSISYAALSQTLYINSTAVIGGSNTNWKILFTSANCSGTGYANVTQQFSGTNSTVLSGLIGTIRAPGDSIRCNLTVSNQGSIDATMSDFTLQDGSLTYQGTTGDTKTSDEQKVNGKLVYTLVYATGDTEATHTPDGSTATVNDDLAHGASRDMVLTITYPLTETELPVNDVTISGFKTTLVYTQK